VKQRIVVLGASGFIGRSVVRSLAETDWAIPVAASRSASAAPIDGRVARIDVDAADPAALVRALDGAAGIVNCIAGPPDLIESVADAVFAAAARLEPRPQVVHLGSLAAYGSATGVVTEESPLRGDLDEYSAAKARCDAVAACHPFVTVLRPGIVYGPGSPWWSDRIARLLTMRRLGDIGPAGEGNCNLVYVADVAAAVVRTLERPATGFRAFNLSLPAPPTWNGYFAAYAAALGIEPLPRIPASRLALETRLLSPALKLLELALRSPAAARRNPLPPLRPWLPRLCAQRIRMDVSLAERLLDMRWTPLERGLEVTAQWFRGGGRTAL
jgi:nucleoside-diphosphate-sugar epimerase